MNRIFSTALRPRGLMHNSNILGTNTAASVRPSLMNRAAAPAAFPQIFVRFGGGRPDRKEFDERALELLRGFEKIDPKKLNLEAHFNKDLGLDSLDTVEVLMAIEDEFMIEIPDQEADQIHSVKQALDYVYDRWTPQHHM